MGKTQCIWNMFYTSAQQLRREEDPTMRKKTTFTMVLLLIVSLFILPSVALCGDYIGTYCWTDNDGGLMELAATSVGDNKNFTFSGVYHQAVGTQMSPVQGNLSITGRELIGVLTMTDRKNIDGKLFALSFVGDIRINIGTLNGAYWGTAITAPFGDVSTVIAEFHPLTLTSCN